jgi:hypothetical protein
VRGVEVVDQPFSFDAKFVLDVAQDVAKIDVEKLSRVA